MLLLLFAGFSAAQAAVLPDVISLGDSGL